MYIVYSFLESNDFCRFFQTEINNKPTEFKSEHNSISVSAM